MAAATPKPDPIRALLPRGSGHQFVFCGDACSGVPGAAHEATFASINAVVRRLSPAPDFIIFAGDEIVGLTADADELRGQWGYWLDHEMAWVDRSTTRVWHTTSNHTVYDAASEQVFREVLALPKNGPPGQEGLSYWVRERDLLMVFVNTVWSGLGGEGHVETDWLRQVLADQADARYKLVIGHHPVFPINGFSGPYQREIGPEYTDIFWSILVEASVSAYLCSHILAFDVQVRRGVLQVCSAGAGTAHRMPEGIEYLHCVQAALDEQSFRYQVLDAEGLVRERLEWPLPELSQNGWVLLPLGISAASFTGKIAQDYPLLLQFSGEAAPPSAAGEQTLFAAFSPGALASCWIGFRGPDQKLTAIVQRAPGRSPSYWLGPAMEAAKPFEITLAVHTGMGPGGILYRLAADDPWSSLSAATAIGVEDVEWPARWSIGHGPGGSTDRPFLGSALVAQTVPIR
jgi:Calcineurin-like phosphoesterase